MHSVRPVLVIIVALMCIVEGMAQDESARSTSISLEFQMYPTGSIPGLALEFGLRDKSAFNVRAGYNVVDHRDLGVQDEENGGGLGFSLGYRKYGQVVGNSFLYGVRTDVWFNSIDWRNDAQSTSGTTRVTVLQPTASIGYQWVMSNGWIITPTLALGAEINISTKGEPVGEGAIGLVGVELGYRF